MVEHYAQRASAGLLIAEATMIDERYSVILHRARNLRPGPNRRMAHGHRRRARAPRPHLPADLARRARVPSGAERRPPAGRPLRHSDHQRPSPHPRWESSTTSRRARSRTHELPGIVEAFRQAAANAQEAGFDGVEVHGANGYLLDEFLRDGANQRSGPYGGPVENRARLLLEVLAAACGVWGADRVGVRISPLNSYNSMSDSDPVGTLHVAGRTTQRLWPRLPPFDARRRAR